MWVGDWWDWVRWVSRWFGRYCLLTCSAVDCGWNWRASLDREFSISCHQASSLSLSTCRLALGPPPVGHSWYTASRRPANRESGRSRVDARPARCRRRQTGSRIPPRRRRLPVRRCRPSWLLSADDRDRGRAGNRPPCCPLVVRWETVECACAVAGRHDRPGRVDVVWSTAVPVCCHSWHWQYCGTVAAVDRTDVDRTDASHQPRNDVCTLPPYIAVVILSIIGPIHSTGHVMGYWLARCKP